MKTVVIQENQKGLLFKNGHYQGLLDAGRYRTWGGRVIEAVPLDAALTSEHCTLDVLLADPAVAEATCPLQVADRQLALHFVDGKFAAALPAGRYAFWQAAGRHSFQLVDLSTTEVTPDVPSYIFPQLSHELYREVSVAPHEKALLYFDKKLVRLLEPGLYRFWRTDVLVEASFVDTRLLQMTVSGQEILTEDKVPLRVSLVCSYRITDPVKVSQAVDNYAAQIHTAAQLALRDYVGRRKLDDLLADKEGISAWVLQKLQAREEDFFVRFVEAGVRDIILPGEIRSIMNTVLAAEKRAQANLIARREEVASTRSLLNTARLLDENETLRRLKELEYLERICENVGSITLNGSGDVLAQLTALVQGKKS